MSRPLVVIAVLLLAASFASPCAAQQELPLVRAWRVGPAPVIVVRGDDVRVRVRPGARDTVALVMKHVIRGGGWRYEERPSAMSAVQDGDTIRIDAHTGGGTVVIGAGAERFDVQLAVAANGPRVIVECEDGRVDLAKVAGVCVVRTANADVRASRVRGTLNVNATRAGEVRASGFDGEVHAHTASGRVRVEGRFDDLDVTSVDGDLEVGIAKGSAGSARLETTGHGAIVLALADGAASGLYVRGAGTMPRLALPGAVTEQIDGGARATFGGRGSVVHARAASGRLTVRVAKR